jgi:hypothetical protein
MWISIRSMMFVIGKGIGACGLGGAILWQVVVHIGPQHGVAYVHVTTPNVDVMVDDVQYHIETMWESPIVCELSSGHHKLRMSRSGRIVYEEGFTLGIGQEIVLTAWEPPSEIQARAALPDHLLNKARGQAPGDQRSP